MPILNVEIVLNPDEELRAGLAGEIADAAGAILGSEAGGMWVKLRELPKERYAENEGGPPEGVWPVFVEVLKAELPQGEEMGKEAAKLATEIGRICGRRRENVHILYLPAGAGRIFFGGR
ncbi:MAG: hypothetical protein IH859_07115 [Chloroflexi bacterium]|nr:hypothetical protein [Chloroflexota bacterium]